MKSDRPVLPRRLLVVLALVATTLAGVTPGAGASEPPHHAVSLQFLHPLATSPHPETRTAVRLSLLWGHSGAVGAFDGGLFATGTSGDVRGLQIVGLYADVGGDLGGVAYSAGVHRVGGDARGLQFGAAASWTVGTVRGVQYGTLLGYAGEGVRGAQISGLVSLSDGSGRGGQIASVASVSGGDLVGAQISSFFNFAGGHVQGWQSATLNFADSMRGVQIGAFNFAGEARGLQLGLINVSDEQHGVPIGLVNLSRHGTREILVYASSVSLANLGLRTEVGGWRAILAGGWHEVGADQTEAGSVSWHFGRRLWGDARRSVGVDVGFLHLMPRAREDGPEVFLHPSLQLRVTGDVALGRHWGLHAALGLAQTATSYEEGAESESEVLVAGGIAWR